MAKLEKRYPPFECVEYDYGRLFHREYDGVIHASIQFADNVDLHVHFYFKEFLDFHKRKKDRLHKAVEQALSEMNGWGSRHFALIERLQADESLDIFRFFAEFIEATGDDMEERYEQRRYRIEELRHKTPQNHQPPPQNREKPKVKKEPPPPPPKDDDDDDDDDMEEEGESPYDLDRRKFHELLQIASNDMYDALKVNFFPQIGNLQRRYPTKFKALNENIEEILYHFEAQMMGELFPELDDNEYKEFDIIYNSQKADMSDDDEPPTAR